MQNGTKIKTGLLKKYHVCGKCGSKNIEENRRTGCYDCLDCKYMACRPSKMWTVKEGHEQDVLEIYHFLVENEAASYSPYLARIIVLGMKIEKGEVPETKDVKHVGFSNEGINIILAK